MKNDKSQLVVRTSDFYFVIVHLSFVIGQNPCLFLAKDFASVIQNQHSSVFICVYPRSSVASLITWWLCRDASSVVRNCRRTVSKFLSGCSACNRSAGSTRRPERTWIQRSPRRSARLRGRL